MSLNDLLRLLWLLGISSADVPFNKSDWGDLNRLRELVNK
jgi:hypothetical protein